MNVILIKSEMMKNKLKSSLLLIVTIGIFTSCDDVTQEVEEKLNGLNKKAEQLDSLINKEVDKVMALDTLINLESDKVKKLDSLINNSSSKLDAIIDKNIKTVEKIINQ